MRSYRLIILCFLLIVLGAAGGLLGTVLIRAKYQAEAYVVVYEMPAGFRELIGPDEANQIESIYQAGALQDAVINRVVQQLSGFTPAEIRASVQVSIVAYTPLSRVTATAATADQAAALANAVAKNWVDVAASANSNAFTTTQNALLGQQQALDTQIADTEKSIQAAGATTSSNQNYINALQSQLQTQLAEEQTVNKTLSQLNVYQMQVAGNGFVTTPATPSAATQTPDRKKTIEGGAAVGAALAVLLILWLLRPYALRGELRWPGRSSSVSRSTSTAEEE